MAVKTRSRKTPRSYFRLVEAFPLVPIRDEAHLIAAQKKIDELLEQKLDDAEEAYLDVLTDLVEAYENEHEQFQDASEADVLRELMAANRLTQAILAKKVKIAQSTISAVLTGARSLTKEHVIKLANFFHVTPMAFMPAGSGTVRIRLAGRD
jgi:HTH-type transcriptional regulator / antitoxin HigA